MASCSAVRAKIIVFDERKENDSTKNVCTFIASELRPAPCWQGKITQRYTAGKVHHTSCNGNITVDRSPCSRRVLLGLGPVLPDVGVLERKLGRGQHRREVLLPGGDDLGPREEEPVLAKVTPLGPKRKLDVVCSVPATRTASRATVGKSKTKSGRIDCKQI